MAVLFFSSQRLLASSAIGSSELPNGLKIIVSEQHVVPLVAIDIWLKAGTRRQAEGQSGVAHYLEHVLFKGTPTHPTEADLDGAVEDLGGSLDAGTSYDWAHFYTIVPSENLKPTLAVMSDALQHATISESAVENERNIILDEIERNLDSPDIVATQVARHSIYGVTHPYGSPITGTASDVRGIKRQQILDFYHKYYVPSNAAVVLSGDITFPNAEDAVRETFGGWQGASAPQDQSVMVSPLHETDPVIMRYPVADSTLVMAFNAPSVHDQPDAWAMDVLLTYLGQGARSDLDDELRRKRHLVKSVNADFLTQNDPGMMTITIKFTPGNYEKILPIALQHIGKVRSTPLSSSGLEAAKEQLLSSYLFDTETVSGKANALGFYEMIDSYRYDRDYVEHIHSVTSEQVMAVASKYLTTDRYVQVLIEPESSPMIAGSIENPSLQSLDASFARSRR